MIGQLLYFGHEATPQQNCGSGYRYRSVPAKNGPRFWAGAANLAIIDFVLFGDELTAQPTQPNA